MKTLILFYSRSGHTKALARLKADELNADIEEITDVKRPSVAIGALMAMAKKRTKINPLLSRLEVYDRIVIMSPVWAGAPVPAINRAIDELPPGKKVDVIMVGAGGGTKKRAKDTMDLIRARGCEIASYSDVMAKKTESGYTSMPLI